MENRYHLKYTGKKYEKTHEGVIGFIDLDHDYLCNVYITNRTIEMQELAQKDFVGILMNQYFKFCNYVSISLFKTEEEEENQLTTSLEVLDLIDMSNQKKIYFELTNDVIEYIKNNYSNDDNEIIWWSYDFYITNEINKSVLSINHCGAEIFITFSKEFRLRDFEEELKKIDIELIK